MSQNGKGSANRTRKHQQFRENHEGVDWDKRKKTRMDKRIKIYTRCSLCNKDYSECTCEE